MHLKSRKAGLLVLSLGLSILASSVLASDIYRYTDEDGNVYYTDRPTGQDDERRLAIESQPTDDAAVRQRFSKRYGDADQAGAGSSNADADADTHGDEEREPTRAERKQAAAERQQECERLRERYEMIYAARRVYQDSPDGERTYLNEEQLAAEREKARQQVEETCD